MKRDDVLNVDALRKDMFGAFEEFQRSMRTIFGDVVSALDTVIDRYNIIETRLQKQEQDHAALAQQFNLVTARLLALEHRDTEH